MRALLATATAVLLLSGLTACSDDDPKPKLEPSSDSPPPTSSPPTSDPPTSDPPPADETAEEFLRRWQEEAYEMQVTGDTSVYRSLSTECSSCDALASSVDDIYDSGGSIRTTASELEGLKEVGGTKPIRIFEYRLRAAPTELVRTEGGSPVRLPGGIERYQVNLRMTDQGWRVVQASELVP